MTEECDPNSILDTDLYKLTMHYAVWCLYPHLEVTYAFINRSKSNQPFSRSAYRTLCEKVRRLETRILSEQESDWLSSNCPYLPTRYLDALRSYRFKPDQHLRIRFNPLDDAQSIKSSGSELDELGDLEISISGLWTETILYEVPLLSMISEAYFETVDRGWSYQSQAEAAIAKATQLFRTGCRFSEFGTRRRRSWKTQFLVIEAIQRSIDPGSNHQFTTSNVWMARRFGLRPMGTMAHEFIMAEGALNGYQGVNLRVMKNWETCFPDHPELWIALTDTFGTKPFFAELALDPDRASKWTGLRQDSGDPKTFGINAKRAWQSIGVDPRTKLIIFSDGLDVNTCCELHKFCESEGLKESYGIGTHFTNDFEKLSPEGCTLVKVKSKPLNIVIKLLTVNDLPCVKLSDVVEKAIGPKEEIAKIRSILEV